MKRTFITLSLICLLPTVAESQHSFVVQNGTPSVYRTLAEAYTAAEPGDTIYLPGGSFDLPGIYKSLVWIGVGYHPDSTIATFSTRINSSANFYGDCDNSYITGIHFSSNVNLGSNGNDAVDVTISRCRIDGSLNLKYSDGQQREINTIVSETIIDNSVNANYGSNILMEKSLVRSLLTGFRNSRFDRLIVYRGEQSSGAGASYAFTNTTGSLITNSVFNVLTYTTWSGSLASNYNNHFANNIYEGFATFPNGTNTGENNISGVDPLTLFEHIEGDFNVFSYLHNFRLQEGSAGIGTGTDGSDISIFSGSSPFKEGGLPFTPHIRLVNIAGETVNGLLPVEIRVAAQEK
ncbi:MAG: hypothetical protein LC649_10890 [Bacteroidales bacterium]|nr:hypothetical protein [Bacteroidales bacterium]